MSRRNPRPRSVKLVLQEPVVRGKQIQIPVYGGGWVDMNVCYRDAKLGNLIAETIARVLRDHAPNVIEISTRKVTEGYNEGCKCNLCFTRFVENFVS